MPVLQHRFTDLARLIDELHGVLDAWGAAARPPEALADEDTLHRLRLAVHEWTANLVQHASFGDRPPLVVLTLAPQPGGAVRCSIDDTSDGFDFASALHRPLVLVGRFPERGMGLRILQASVLDLSYGEAPSGGHRLAFVVTPADDTPFFDVL